MRCYAYFIVLLCFGLSTASVQSQETPAEEFLVADSATQLLHFSGGRLTIFHDVPSGTFLRTAGPPKSVVAHPGRYRWVQILGDGNQPSGWVDRAKCTNLSTVVKCYPNRQLQQHRDRVQVIDLDIEKTPLLIYRRQSPTLTKLWLRNLELFEKAKGEPPPELFFARAEIWEKVLNHHAALNDYSEGISILLQTKADTVTKAKAFEKLYHVTKMLREVPRLPQYSRATTYYDYGKQAFWSGDTKRALRNFDDAVALAPREPLYWYYRAITYKKLGDERRANYDLRVGVDLEFEEENQSSRLHDTAFMLEQLSRFQGPDRVWFTGIRTADPDFRTLSTD